MTALRPTQTCSGTYCIDLFRATIFSSLVSLNLFDSSFIGCCRSGSDAVDLLLNVPTNKDKEIAHIEPLSRLIINPLFRIVLHQTLQKFHSTDK